MPFPGVYSAKSMKDSHSNTPIQTWKPVHLRLVKLWELLTRPASIFILFFIIMLGLFSLVRLQRGDDRAYAGAYLQFSLPGFLAEEYQSWSGRVLTDILFYTFAGPALFLWSWLCASSATLCAVIFYRFVTYNREMTSSEKSLFACLSAGGIALVGSPVLFPSVFWITGALVYLVPFALGAAAFLPFFYALQDEKYTPPLIAFLYLAPAALAVLGSEQSALCYTAFCLLALIALLIRKRRIPAVLWSMFGVSVIFQIFSLTAPGNAVRQAEEIIKWFPTYRELGLFNGLAISLHFLFNTILDEWFLLLFFVWLLSACLLLRGNPTRIAKTVAWISFGLAFLIGSRLLFSLDDAMTNSLGILYKQLATFHYLTKANIFQPAAVLPYMLWGLGLCLPPVSIFLIFKKSGLAFFYSAIYLAALAAIILMVFSPTLYASGGRTSFVSNMLLVLLILLLLRHSDLLKYFTAAILLIAVIKILMLYAYLGKNGYDFIDGTLSTKGIPFKVFR